MTQHLEIATSPDGPSGELLSTEWLLTNGLGSFACGTVVGTNSRKYHGLLVAAGRAGQPGGQQGGQQGGQPVRPRQPGERAMLLSNVVEELVIGGEVFPLSCFEFDGAFHPRGDRSLVAFDCDKAAGCVAFTYRLIRKTASGAKARGSRGATPITLVKRFALARGSDAIALRYELTGLPLPPGVPMEQCRMRVAPLLAYRHYHHNRAAGPDPAVVAEWDGDFLRLGAPTGSLPAMRFRFPSRERKLAGMRESGDPPASFRSRLGFQSAPDWWHRFFYRLEAGRGEPAWEDLFTPGRFELAFEPDGSAELHAAVEPAEPVSFAEATGGQQKNHRRLIELASAHHANPLPKGEGYQRRISSPVADLIVAGEDFIVQLPDGPGNGPGPQVSILAGFPWFADWGRDAFISLPGLLLTSGLPSLPSRTEEALGVLRRFGGAIRDGLVPNRFSDESPSNPSPSQGEGRVRVAAQIPCDYNSVDAGLWFIHAAFAWAQATGDWRRFDDELLGPAGQIIDAYHGGTKFNIHVDADGLLVCGDETVQVTWMDAMVTPGSPVTPRAGKPVEVNALFGHALLAMARRFEATGEVTRCATGGLPASAARAGKPPVAHSNSRAATYRHWHDQWAGSFAAAFPSPRGGLYDYISLDGQPNDLIRPNQLLAVSLGDCPLPDGVQRDIVQIAIDELLTPVGLRTLARGEPGYQGQCVGPQWQRDAAYHQGTVWAWLMGPFIEAYLRVNAFSETAKKQAGRWIQPLIEHMNHSACLGQISEIFDGDEPHTPRGAFAQAWSVAEVRRVMAML